MRLCSHCQVNSGTQLPGWNIDIEQTCITIDKLSRGEICVANFIPPVNGASQGNYFLPKKLEHAMSELQGMDRYWKEVIQVST